MTDPHLQELEAQWRHSVPVRHLLAANAHVAGHARGDFRLFELHQTSDAGQSAASRDNLSRMFPATAVGDSSTHGLFAVLLVACTTPAGQAGGDGAEQIIESTHPYCGAPATSPAHCESKQTQDPWWEGRPTPVGAYACTCDGGGFFDVDVGADCEDTISQVCGVDLSAPQPCFVADGDGGSYVCDPVDGEQGSWQCRCGIDSRRTLARSGSCESAAMSVCAARCSDAGGHCELSSEAGYECACAGGGSASWMGTPIDIAIRLLRCDSRNPGALWCDGGPVAAPGPVGANPCENALSLSCETACETASGLCMVRPDGYECRCSSGALSSIAEAFGNCSAALESACGGSP
jgi:hypothetical protein